MYCSHLQVDVLNSSIPAPTVVDLEPGEVIYLPPYWFHCVITLIPSISLNVWSDSESYVLMEEILTSPIPFESSWSQEVLLAGVKFFVVSLIERLDFGSSFVRDNVLPRSVIAFSTENSMCKLVCYVLCA